MKRVTFLVRILTALSLGNKNAKILLPSLNQEYQETKPNEPCYGGDKMLGTPPPYRPVLIRKPHVIIKMFSKHLSGVIRHPRNV